MHQLHGNPSKLPEGALEAAPAVVVNIPDPPEFLSEEARAEWDRITPHLEPLKLVSDMYLAALAIYCAAYGDWVVARKRLAAQRAAAAKSEDVRDDGYIASTPQGYKQISATMVVIRDAEARLLKYAVHFGLTPAAWRSVTGGANPQGTLFPETDPMSAFTQAGASLPG